MTISNRVFEYNSGKNKQKNGSELALKLEWVHLFPGFEISCAISL